MKNRNNPNKNQLKNRPKQSNQQPRDNITTLRPEQKSSPIKLSKATCNQINK